MACALTIVCMSFYLHLYLSAQPENVLLGRDGHLVLTDFGFAKDKIVSAEKGTGSFCGTSVVATNRRAVGWQWLAVAIDRMSEVRHHLICVCVPSLLFFFSCLVTDSLNYMGQAPHCNQHCCARKRCKISPLTVAAASAAGFLFFFHFPSFLFFLFSQLLK